MDEQFTKKRRLLPDQTGDTIADDAAAPHLPTHPPTQPHTQPHTLAAPEDLAADDPAARHPDDTAEPPGDAGDAVATASPTEPRAADVSAPGDGDAAAPEDETPVATEASRKGDGFGVHLLPRIAEKEGFNLAQFEEGVWEILALAVEYRLRTLVEEALRICRRSLHRQSELCLDSRSVLLALKLLHWEQVPPACLRSRADNKKSLDECMEQDMGVPLPLLPSLTVKWVGLNGTIVSPQYVRNCLEDREPQPAWRYVPNVKMFKRDFVNTKSESRFIMSVIFDDHLSDQSEPTARILTIPKGLTDGLGEEQKLFLERISNVVTAAMRDTQIRGDDSERAQIRVALEKVIRSLSGGRIPQKLLPYVLSLLCGEVSTVVLDGTSEGVLILLDLIRALSQNQNIQLHAYLHQAIQALFTCMLTPLIGGATSMAVQSAMTVRRTAAEILASIVTQSAAMSGSVAAYSSAVEILSEVLRKPYLPLPTLLGAILGARALGPLAIKKAVLPVTRDLIDALKVSLQETNTNMEVADIREYLKSSMLELLMACTTVANKGHGVGDPMQNYLI